jgi:UDP-2-acetamido-3-amino-2,3-dideoxy-glucuronate N-acetyltransferase
MTGESASESGPFIHPHALCESEDVGDGTRVWAFAHVLPGASIGERCNICDHVFVEGRVRIGDGVTVKNGVLLFDGVTIDDDVFIGPGVVFTNDRTPRAAVKKTNDELLPTAVHRGATLGAGVVVVCGTTIGEFALVAAGSVVTRDVAPYALVLGNPARRRGWACECGLVLDEALACSCGRSYRSAGDGLRPVDHE